MDEPRTVQGVLKFWQDFRPGPNALVPEDATAGVGNIGDWWTAELQRAEARSGASAGSVHGNDAAAP